jgi:hypothetical protein
LKPKKKNLKGWNEGTTVQGFPFKRKLYFLCVFRRLVKNWEKTFLNCLKILHLFYFKQSPRKGNKIGTYIWIFVFVNSLAVEWSVIYNKTFICNAHCPDTERLTVNIRDTSVVVCYWNLRNRRKKMRCFRINFVKSFCKSVHSCA